MMNITKMKKEYAEFMSSYQERLSGLIGKQVVFAEKEGLFNDVLLVRYIHFSESGFVLLGRLVNGENAAINFQQVKGIVE